VGDVLCLYECGSGNKKGLNEKTTENKESYKTIEMSLHSR
jgi:hypothetical protein